MPADPARVKSLFFAAADLPPADRPGFVAAVPDPDERAALQRLLGAHDAPEVRLDATAALAPPGATLPPPTDDTAAHSTADVGQLVADRYRLLERIGEGGMGTVWLAQQSEPVKRKVAVKLIKAGMDSKAVLARFEAERQALALMDHPSIAKILDGGLHDGRPFFVMELVKGVPITEYCDARKLTPKERLELFVPVCQAIQHAHQKGVIHRDIKPNNVLVALYDDRPVPKVIDFGIAKATGGTLTEQTIETAFGGVVGTPQYMSPEQASLNNLDIDTRSDVYSLGVLLYELLTGSPPFARKELEKRGLLEILRVVREEEPPRPSNKLSTADALPSLSASRGTDPKRLTGLLRNELDWIVMKALEKDRSRRYETANGFAADVNRYLSGEAVQAHPPSTAYRVKKFVRRHKGQVLAASLVLFALVAGIAGTTAGLVRAERQERLAVAAREDADTKRVEAEQAREAEVAERRQAEAARQAEADQRKKAEAKETEASAVVQFFEKKVFAAAMTKGRDGGLGKDVSLREAITASLPSLASELKAQPLVEARLRLTLSNTLANLGEVHAAVEQGERGRAIVLERLGPDDPFTLTAMGILANSYTASGRRSDAARLLSEALTVSRRVHGTDHLTTIHFKFNLASNLMEAGYPKDAVKVFEELLPVLKRVLPPDDAKTFALMHNLAATYMLLDRHTDARKLFEETLAAEKRVFPPDDPATLRTMNNLASLYYLVGRPNDALPLMEQVLSVQKRILPANHPDTFAAMYTLALIKRALGRHQEALDLNEAAFVGQAAVLGSSNLETLKSLNNVIASLLALERSAEAVPRIDDFLIRSKGVAAPSWAARVCGYRSQHFEQVGDAAGCRATAAIWEGCGFRDANSLYDAGCFRAISARLYTKSNQPSEATADADRAMAWLTKAVAAGYKDRAHMVKDADLDFLRGRADFKALLATLPERAPKPRPVP